MSRLTIEISEHQHQHIKALAALQGKSIKEYALERLFSDATVDDESAWQELKQLLNERILQAQSGAVSLLHMEEIQQEELNKL